MDRSTWIAIAILGILFWLAEVDWYIYLIAPFVFIGVFMVISVPLLLLKAIEHGVPFWELYKRVWLSFLPWRRRV
jgi:hypothetical protein